MEKIYIYIRRSTASQRYSFITQETTINEHLSNNSDRYIILGQLEETCTGMNTNRPSFNNMVDYCINNDITLMISHIDRMTRSVSDFDNLVFKGLRFISLDSIGNSFEEIRFKVLMSEMITKRNNTSTSNALKEAKKFKRLGNPNGWDGKQIKAQLTRKNNMMEWVAKGKQIYDVASKSQSLSQAAKRLNDMNIKTFRAGTWQANLVKTFLNNYNSV